MRLTLNLILVILFISCFNRSYAQKHDSTYWRAWSQLYKIIDSSFRHRADTSIVEQTALVEFKLTDGKVDTFNIWTIYDHEITNWLVPFLKPAIGRYFPGYKPFKHVVVPVRAWNFNLPERDPVPADQDFIFRLMGLYKHTFHGEITFAQGIILEPPWPARQ